MHRVGQDSPVVSVFGDLGDSIFEMGKIGEMGGWMRGGRGTVAEDVASFDINGVNPDLKMLTQHRQLNLPSPTTYKPP